MAVRASELSHLSRMSFFWDDLGGCASECRTLVAICWPSPSNAATTSRNRGGGDIELLRRQTLDDPVRSQARWAAAAPTHRRSLLGNIHQ